MDEVNLRALHIWLTHAMKHTEWNFRKLKYKLPRPFSFRGRRGAGSACLCVSLWYINTFSTRRYILFSSCWSLCSQTAASWVNVMPWDLCMFMTREVKTFPWISAGIRESPSSGSPRFELLLATCSLLLSLMDPFIMVSGNSSGEHQSIPNLTLKSKHLHDRGPEKLFFPLGLKRLLLKEDSRF